MRCVCILRVASYNAHLYIHVLAQFLASKHKNATKQLAAATIHLAALESNIGDASVLAQWRQAEAVWERDVVDSTKHKALQNPYVLNQAKGESLELCYGVHNSDT